MLEPIDFRLARLVVVCGSAVARWVGVDAFLVCGLWSVSWSAVGGSFFPVLIDLIKVQCVSSLHALATPPCTACTG